MSWQTALLMAPVPFVLIGYETYKKSVLQRSKFTKRLFQQMRKQSKQDQKLTFTQMISQKTIKRTPKALKKRLQVLKNMSQQNYLIDHGLATSFGILGQLIGSQITVRLYLIYGVIHLGHIILEAFSVLTGNSFYDYSKFQYFNRLMTYGIVGTFAFSSINRMIQIAKTGTAIVPK